MPLTDVAIRRSAPPEKPYKLFDERGLYLAVSPAGGRWWRLKYRFARREKRLSLGVCPDVGLKDARERRDQARKLLSNGIDPSENRKAQKAAESIRSANSFEVVAGEWYVKHESGWVHSSRTLRLPRQLEV
jgi:Arm DNA-binding domain